MALGAAESGWAHPRRGKRLATGLPYGLRVGGWCARDRSCAGFCSATDGVVFFVGSIFFTLAAAMELREGTVRRGHRWGRDPSWWSAAVQFAGTLLFNVSTFSAMQESLSTQQENRLIWAPDVFGSACFLVSGALAYRMTAGPGLRPRRVDRTWTTVAVNLLGCILFGISAIASFIVPSTGSILHLAAANWCTALGALCFFIGALLPLPRLTSS